MKLKIFKKPPIELTLVKLDSFTIEQLYKKDIAKLKPSALMAACKPVYKEESKRSKKTFTLAGARYLKSRVFPNYFLETFNRMASGVYICFDKLLFKESEKTARLFVEYTLSLGWEARLYKSAWGYFVQKGMSL